MFKKKPNTKNLAPLRSSDRRKVVDDIISTYGIKVPESVDQQDGQASGSGIGQLRNALLPDGALSAKFSTTTGADLKTVNGTIYVALYGDDEQRILWIRIADRTIPTVYTLWRNPCLVPLLHTPDIVLDKIKGGADLMTPGLADEPPFPKKATKGAIVAIAGLTHPSVPIAVGECEIDISSLQTARGAKGHAVRSLHWAGDEIWDWSHHDRPGLQPPKDIAGWLEDKTHSKDVDDLQDEVEDLALGNEEDGGVPLTNSQVDEYLQPIDEIPLKEWSTKDIDATFRKAFLYSVWQARETGRQEPKYGIDLPIDQSKFMSHHILPFLPIFDAQDTEALQIKKTSWKNVKKFIKALDKEVLLKSKERQGGEIVVLDIDFDDQSIVSFSPYKLPKKQSASGGGGGAGGENASTDDSIGQTLKRLVLLKPNERLAPLLRAANASRADLYLAAEIREIVKQYVEDKNLANANNRRLVNIDPVISEAILDPSVAVDAEVLNKGTIPRDTLLDRIVTKACSQYYKIIRNDESNDTAKPKAGTAPNIKITMETRSGNKTATKVSGLEFYHIRPALFKDELQKTCASSTTIGLLPGSSPKENLQEIMLQGPQKDAVMKGLEKRGVKKDWVDFQDKTKKKK